MPQNAIIDEKMDVKVELLCQKRISYILYTTKMTKCIIKDGENTTNFISTSASIQKSVG